MQLVFRLTVLLFLLHGSASGIESRVVEDWKLQDGRTKTDDAWLKDCKERRSVRLKTLKEKFPKIVFTKHFNLGGSHYAYTEAQSDAQAERNFRPGSALCLLELGEDGEYHEKTLLADPNGVIRDPAVSFDAKKIVFAWKKSDREDDYHLYDYDVASGTVRQLTFSLGYADYEPCVLPDGGIVFNSTRCVQIVDCWWTEVSNLYHCDSNGDFLRRLSFDQVHTNYPTQLDDGRVIYTRWDYNDRGQIFPQGLFQMNPDGTGQTELYGNNSWFPTTILHARGIPGTGKIIAVFSGHHTDQRGKLGILDPSKGRQENSGTQLIAPIQETKAERIDAYGQHGDQFAHPFPITEREFLVSYHPNCGGPRKYVGPFGIYWIDVDGNRELLAHDSSISSSQPVPLAVRTPIPQRGSTVDLESDFGTYTMQDVYFGPGLAGIERGKAKKLRVIALDFRSVGIGRNGNHGPSGGALVSTPIAASHGTWDVKIPLGDAEIYADGSASFKVPARTPLYFQVLDENGHCIQTMRSWSTLQPGEHFACIGCHEDKNSTTQSGKPTLAMNRGPQNLTPLDGPPRGFSFPKEIQPILDKHCIGCHQNDEKTPEFALSKNLRRLGPFTLEPQTVERVLGRPILPNSSAWNYSTKDPGPGWFRPEFFDKANGFPKEKGRFSNVGWGLADIWIWTTLDLPEDWKSEQILLRFFHDEDFQLYINGREVCSANGFNVGFDVSWLREDNGLKPGRNFLAAHCKDSGGSWGIDLGLYAVNPTAALDSRESASFTEKAFSLKGDTVLDPCAKRSWSKSYLNLIAATREQRKGDDSLENSPFAAHQNRIVNWINVQESPAMLPPYKAGAARSELLRMFDPNLAPNGRTHNDVKLTRNELDKLACWIDLLIPYCGDYLEANAWNEKEREKFEYYEKKRREMRDLDKKNTRRLLSEK